VLFEAFETPPEKEKGDIGYWASGKVPIRKSITDGMYTRNGSSPEDDWIGFYPIEENPHVINPKEGYIEACNNRVINDDSFHSMGTTFLTTSRGIRADRMLRERIKSGVKADINFFKQMQTDLKDEAAVILSPLMIEVAQKMKTKFYKKDSEEMKIIDRLISILKGWDGDTSADSKPALVHNMWLEQILNTLLHKYFDSEYERFSVVNSFFSDIFAGNMLKKWAKMDDLANDFCWTPQNINTTVPCGFNVVYALLKTYEEIVAQLGENEVLFFFIVTINDPLKGQLEMVIYQCDGLSSSPSE
jgi:hypothetical protein